MAKNVCIGKKHESHFKIATRVIPETAITPLSRETGMQSTDESDVDGTESGGLFSPVGSDREMEMEMELGLELDDEFEFDWFADSSHPKSFRTVRQPEKCEESEVEVVGKDLSVSEDLKGLILPKARGEDDDGTGNDVELPINEDFWKEVDTSVGETDVEIHVQDFHGSALLTGKSSNLAASAASAAAAAAAATENSSASVAAIEDFIKMDNYSFSNGVGTNSGSSSMEEHAEARITHFMYPIKKFTFRDASGKLVLDPQVSANPSGISTATHTYTRDRILKARKAKSKFKKISRSREGWCEMVSTGVGIGEFMLV